MSLECKPSFSQTLDSLRGESFDVMLVDLAASDLQGPDGLSRVGKVAQELLVIVLADAEETDRVIAARGLGICNWLTKDKLPFSFGR